MTEALKCSVCDSTDFKKLYDIDNIYSIIKCAACGLWLNHPAPSKEEIEKIYAGYHENWGVVGSDEEMHRKMRYMTFDRLLSEVEKFRKPAGKLLDIGCAIGICLEAAEMRGWDVYGIDISEKAIEIARRRFGPKVRVLDFEISQETPSKFYDLVIMTDVLEHLKDVKSAMKRVCDMLTPGGIVVIVTIDTECFYAKLMGKNWVHIRRDHLTYFSKRNLAELLRKTGFEVLSFKNSYKSLNLYYLKDYMRQTREESPRFKKIFLFLESVIAGLPKIITNYNLMIPTGDITVMARKV